MFGWASNISVSVSVSAGACLHNVQDGESPALRLVWRLWLEIGLGHIDYLGTVGSIPKLDVVSGRHWRLACSVLFLIVAYSLRLRRPYM